MPDKTETKPWAELLRWPAALAPMAVWLFWFLAGYRVSSLILVLADGCFVGGVVAASELSMQASPARVEVARGFLVGLALAVLMIPVGLFIGMVIAWQH